MNMSDHNLQNLKEYLSRRPYWKKIWQVVSGSIQNITTSEIENALFANKVFLQIGLLQYTVGLDVSGAEIEDGPDLTGPRFDNKNVKVHPPRTEEFKEFLIRLSKYLKVGKRTTWKLLTSYIMYEYCGSLNNLDKFKYEMHILPMLSNIWKYYTSERMFKLKIIKTCLEFMNLEGHPYAPIYRKFINDIGIRKLWDSLLKQYKFLLQEITSDSLDNDTPIKLWLERNIREQIEILHCMVIMVNYVSVTLNDFRTLLTMFKSNGFGGQTCCFEAKKIIEESSLEKLKYAVFAVILCIGDEFWGSGNKWSTEEDDEQIDEEMEELVRSQDLAPMPVVYVWVLMHMVLPNASDLFNNKYSAWTMKVLNTKIFNFFNQMIRHEMFKHTSIVGINVREAMYHLVFITIEKFNQDDSFFNQLGSLELSSELLKTKQLSDEFFEQSPNGLMLLWNNTINYFPYKFTNIALLAEAIVSSNSENINLVMKEMEVIKVYTIPADEQSIFLNPSEHIKSLLVGTQGHFSDKEISFNPGFDQTSDISIFKHDGVSLLRVFRDNNFWCEFTDILNSALAVGSDLNVIMDKLLSGLKLTLAIFRHEPKIISKYEYLQTIIKQAVNMFVRCCGETDPPMELLAVCLDLLTETIKNYRGELISKMNNHKLLPTLFKDTFKYEEMFSMDSFNMGAIGTIILTNDKSKDHHLLVISFLKFLRTCLHTNKKDYFAVEFPGLIFTLKIIYLHFPIWYSSRETILKDVLYHIVGILYEMFQFTEEELLRDPIRNNMHLLTLCCLLDEPWSRIMLQMLVIGSNNIQFVMENQTNWYKGKGVKHVTTIQLILSVLLQVLQNRKKIENHKGPFPLENFIYSENSNMKVIKAVANLLNHPFNNSIPNLACRLLKKFTVELETSMLASLELEPDQVRLMFLQRLRDNLESEDLKSAIIELITAGVCCQSGMTEAFFTTVGAGSEKLQEKVKDSTKEREGGKHKKVQKAQLSLNESVGNFMIEYLIQATMNTEGQHSPLLYNIMELFHALWMNQKELLIKDLINDEHFWESLCNPLFKNINFQNRLYAQILNIITKEIHKYSGKISMPLQVVVKKLLSPNQGFTAMWLDYIFKESNLKFTIEDPKPYPSLLGAWKNLNMVVVKLMSEDFIELEYKIKITKKCRLALKHNIMLLEDTEKIIVCAELYLFLMSQWGNLAYLNSEELYEDVIDLLHKAAISYTNLPKRMQQTILAVAVVCFKNLKSIDSDNYIASNILVESLISIFNHEYDALQISLKSNQLQSFDRKTHQGYFLCFAILNELINSPNCELKADYMEWLNQSILFKNILACAGLLAKNVWTMALAKDALETLIFYSKLDESVNFINTDIALELWQQFLPLKEYFKPTDLGTVQLVPQNVKNWWMIYKRLLMLLTIVLKKHSHFVKKEVVMFVSLHEEYIIQILQLVVTSVDFYALDLVLITLNLIYELMNYRDYWKLDHEQSYNSILEAVKTTLQCSSTLVVRPTVLKYFIINKLNNQTIQSESVPTRNLIRIMDMMTNIISMSCRIVMFLSPPLLQQVTDNKDYSYWELQLNVNFGIPKWGECELTTGTLVCLLCLYVRTLQQIAQERKLGAEKGTTEKIQSTQVSNNMLNKTASAKMSKHNKSSPRVTLEQIEKEIVLDNEDMTQANIFITKPSYSDTVVGFIRLDYLNPFCNLSTVQNFTHSTTVTVFPWHSKLNETYVVDALESVLTLLATQVGPLIKYRTYDKLNMRYISRELSSELQIFHDYIRKKLTDLYHFTGKDRSSFVRKNAAAFSQEETKKKHSMQKLKTSLKKRSKAKTTQMQTDHEKNEDSEFWQSGVDYIFVDLILEQDESVEVLYSHDDDMMQTGVNKNTETLKHKQSSKSRKSLEKQISSVEIAGPKRVEYIYRNPYLTLPPMKMQKSREPSRECKRKHSLGGPTGDRELELLPDDYMQFLSNWFMYVLQKDNK